MQGGAWRGGLKGRKIILGLAVGRVPAELEGGAAPAVAFRPPSPGLSQS